MKANADASMHGKYNLGFIHFIKLIFKFACDRYVDLIVTEGVKGTLRARARMMGALRRTLEARGFLEVETPVLETSAGGADARPFTTFHNALQQPYVLRIATGTENYNLHCAQSLLEIA